MATLWVRKASVERAKVMSEEEGGSTVKSESCDGVLDVDRKSRAETSFEKGDAGVGVSSEVVEVSDSIAAEERAGHAAVKPADGQDRA
jgi:hypothetical protein